MRLWSQFKDFFSQITGSWTGPWNFLSPSSKTPQNSTAFTVALIALCAKLAKTDGLVTKDEIIAFRDIFTIPEEEEKNVARFFNIARKDSRGFEPYARQVGRLFKDEPILLEQLLACLMYIAKADGIITKAEITFLKTAAQEMGLTEKDYYRISALEMIDTDNLDEISTAFSVLGLTPEASFDEIRKTYRHLVKEYHPDRLIAKGLPQEAVKTAEQRLIKINQSFELLKKQLYS